MSTLNNIECQLDTFKLISNLNILRLKGLFSEIQQDPYIEEGYRYKSLARCRLNHFQLEKQPHTTLFQDRDINPVNGGTARVYPELSNLDYAKEAIMLFAKTFKIDYSYEILAQAQRTKCNNRNLGITTPEGFHRDGIDFLAIVCVSRHNIVGGKTQLLNSGGQIIFESILSPGEMILIDDAKFLHYTSPIAIKDPQLSNYGFRDVLILSSAKGFVNQKPALLQ